MDTRKPELKIGAAQMAAGEGWQENLATATIAIREAVSEGVELLVLPEGVLARFIGERERIRTHAQPLDGPFVTGLAEVTRDLDLTVVVGIHEVSDNSRPYNTLVVLRDGEVIGLYRKLHLYDAFQMHESENVTPADVVPPLIDVNGFRLGLMTCYDVRFPELARLLAVAGADIIAVPAAWVRGPLKEEHWRVMVTARALENTVYVIGSGECGPRNIGRSLIVDPLGVTVAQGADVPALITTTATRARLEAAREQLPVLANRRFDVTPAALPIEAPIPTA